MKISLHLKDVERRQPVEREVSRHVAKLETRLRTYAPDLVQLHGSIDKHPRKMEYEFTLNLSLPTGTLHVTGSGADTRQSIKEAFSELELQLKKHQARVRKDYQWKRKRARKELAAES